MDAPTPTPSAPTKLGGTFGSIGGTLRSPVAGVPMWIWVVMGIGALAFWIQHQDSKKPKGPAAANAQDASDLGSAAELANMFTVAGLMPYQGGNVYVNTSQTNNNRGKPGPPWPGPPGTPPDWINKPWAPTSGPGPRRMIQTRSKTVQYIDRTKPLEYVAKQGESLDTIGKRFGMSGVELWRYNVDLPLWSKSVIVKMKKRGMHVVAGEHILIPKKGTMYSGGWTGSAANKYHHYFWPSENKNRTAPGYRTQASRMQSNAEYNKYVNSWWKSYFNHGWNSWWKQFYNATGWMPAWAQKWFTSPSSVPDGELVRDTNRWFSGPAGIIQGNPYIFQPGSDPYFNGEFGTGIGSSGARLY